MIPMGTLLLWSAFLGISRVSRIFPVSGLSGLSVFYGRFRKFLWPALLFSVTANCFIFLHALRSDLWREHGTFRELGSHLGSTPGVCAVLAAGESSSIMMPFGDPASAPSPAFGALSLARDRQGYEELQGSEIDWFDHAPHCNLVQRVLLHTHRLHPGWTEEGCTLLPSGLLRTLPKFAQDWVLQQGYKASTWYNCPSSIFNYFGSQKVHEIYSHKFNRIEKLPALSTTARELENLGHQTSPPPRDISLPALDNPWYAPSLR